MTENLEAALRVALAKLQEIKVGCETTGRWLDCSKGYANEAVGEAREDVVPEGYYDNHNPPAEDDFDDPPPYPDGMSASICDNLRLVGGVWLAPAEWMPYTTDEQVEWMETCGDLASGTLQEITDILGPLTVEAIKAVGKVESSVDSFVKAHWPAA